MINILIELSKLEEIIKSNRLDILILTDKYLDRIDIFFFRFLRRIVGIKTSYYSRINNHGMRRTANYSKKSSEKMHKTQYKMLNEIFFADIDNPMHNMVFASNFRDRIRIIGYKGGRKKILGGDRNIYFFRHNLARDERGPYCLFFLYL